MNDIRKILHKQMEGFNYIGWVADNMSQHVIFGLKEVEHVAHCLELLVNEFLGKEAYDGFIEALSKENYKDAMMLADDINSVAIKTYAIFISTFVPQGLIRKK